MILVTQLDAAGIVALIHRSQKNAVSAPDVGPDRRFALSLKAVSQRVKAYLASASEARQSLFDGVAPVDVGGSPDTGRTWAVTRL